jgi:hypothetical protein
MLVDLGLKPETEHIDVGGHVLAVFGPTVHGAPELACDRHVRSM